MTDASTRTEPTATERRALQQLKQMYLTGDATHGFVRNPTTVRLLSAVQTADVASGYTDRAKGVAVQVHQAAGELLESLGSKPVEILVRRRTLLRRLRTVEILQMKAQWFK
jgi:hypothetical protein